MKILLLNMQNDTKQHNYGKHNGTLPMHQLQLLTVKSTNAYVCGRKLKQVTINMFI
jgi:hypothetical protein